MSNKAFIGIAIHKISEQLAKDTSTEVNLNAEIDNLLSLLSMEITEDDREQIRKGIEEKTNFRTAHREAGATLIPISMVMDPEEHVEWYDDWVKDNDTKEGRYHWRRLEDFLQRELSRKYGSAEAGMVVRSIDSATEKTMGLLADPARKEFDFKGMVVGYVQSGKTANFTGLIAKAADAGYRLIVVFSGIHNILREQTQIRLDKELTGVRDFQSTETFVSKPKAAATWERMTNANFDFSSEHTGLFSQACQSPGPVLAVTKKNVKVMDKLIAYLAAATPKERATMPLLVIDDEADQASIDTKANDPDTDPSKTNAFGNYSTSSREKPISATRPPHSPTSSLTWRTRTTCIRRTSSWPCLDPMPTSARTSSSVVIWLTGTSKRSTTQRSGSTTLPHRRIWNAPYASSSLGAPYELCAETGKSP